MELAKGTDEFDYLVAVPAGALFVAADEPLLIYPSAAAAELHLEAIDVRNGEYPVAYGPRGQFYRLLSDGTNVFVEATGERDRPDDLKALLIRYLTAIGYLADETAAVEDLVAMAWEREAAFWRDHDPYGERFGTAISSWGCAAFVAIVLIACYIMLR